jgi:hypothetical protein
MIIWELIRVLVSLDIYEMRSRTELVRTLSTRTDAISATLPPGDNLGNVTERSPLEMLFGH